MARERKPDKRFPSTPGLSNVARQIAASLKTKTKATVAPKAEKPRGESK